MNAKKRDCPKLGRGVIDPDFKRDILESDIPRDVLDVLLLDRTTGKNILWMTDGYEHLESVLDVKMGVNDEINAGVISRPGNKIIRPRVDKGKEEQRKRVVGRAEVFTPSWICNAMNNLMDAAWFGRKTSPFTVEGNKSWRATKKRVNFTKRLKKTWLDFVAEVRLEITCGEAPFLASRYDTTTGEVIPIPERIGILDRKLRIVTENVGGEPKEWLKHAKMALKAILGFEWQGDNVFLARENVLWTVLEYYKYYCSSTPINHRDLLELANIVSWNIWQMDGLKFVVPLSCHDETIVQKAPKAVRQGRFVAKERELAEQIMPETKSCPGCAKKHILDGAELHNGTYCKIMDWETGEPYEFVWHYLHGKERDKHSTIAGAVGNPPYQKDDGGNGRSASAIYPEFLGVGSTTVTGCVSMIMPAKWYSGGKGLDQFRSEMLNSGHISRLVDFMDSHQCFGDVADVAGGVCYFLHSKGHDGVCKCVNYDSRGNVTAATRNLGERDVFVRHPTANGIIGKIEARGEHNMSEMVSPRKPFGLATNVVPIPNGDLSLRTNTGWAKYKREKLTVGVDLVGKWNVMMSYLSAEHAGQPDKNGMFKVLSSLDILPPDSICTETYILAGSFSLKEHAKNLLSYLKTRFVRFLVGQVAMTQHITRNSFCFVPVQDFSVRWTDEDLYAKYEISDVEKKFIESIIKEM